MLGASCHSSLQAEGSSFWWIPPPGSAPAASSPSGACPSPLPAFQHLLFSPRKRNVQPPSPRKALLGASLLTWGICEGQFLLKPASVWVQTLPGHSEHSPCSLGRFPCPEAWANVTFCPVVRHSFVLQPESPSACRLLKRLHRDFASPSPKTRQE